MLAQAKTDAFAPVMFLQAMQVGISALLHLACSASGTIGSQRTRWLSVAMRMRSMLDLCASRQRRFGDMHDVQRDSQTHTARSCRQAACGLVHMHHAPCMDGYRMHT